MHTAVAKESNDTLPDPVDVDSLAVIEDEASVVRSSESPKKTNAPDDGDDEIFMSNVPDLNLKLDPSGKVVNGMCHCCSYYDRKTSFVSNC